MDSRTVRHYDDRAKELAVRYELTGMTSTHGLFAKQRGAILPGNWQYGAFAGLVEGVETLAAQRGRERWEP